MYLNGDKVQVKNSNIKGIIVSIDRNNFLTAIRINIKEGKSPVTDYFEEDLILLPRDYEFKSN